MKHFNFNYFGIFKAKILNIFCQNDCLGFHNFCQMADVFNFCTTV